MKQCLMLLMMVVITLTPIQGAEKKTNEEYGAYFQQIFELIQREYLYEKSPQELYEAAIKGMFDQLDVYSEFIIEDDSQNFSNNLNSTYVGIGVSLVLEGDYVKIDRVFMGGPAELGGVLPGDLITAINGVSAKGFSLRDVQERVIGEKGTSVTITFNRSGATYTTTLIRNTIVLKSVESTDLSRLLNREGFVVDPKVDKQTRYVRIETFASQTVASELKAFITLEKSKGTTHLILDLRNNGGGYVDAGLAVLDQLVKEATVLKFVDNQGRETIYGTTLKEEPFEIVAIINENSASATEFVAAALKESEKAILVGETTYGKGVAQSILNLQDGSVVKITTNEFFSGNNTKINGIGVAPDVEVILPKYIASNDRFYLSDNNEGVYHVETALKFLGYVVDTPDTVYDRKTIEAVKAFQRDSGLYVYGVCDFTTQKYLNAALMKKLESRDLQLEQAYKIVLEKLK